MKSAAAFLIFFPSLFLYANSVEANSCYAIKASSLTIRSRNTKRSKSCGYVTSMNKMRKVGSCSGFRNRWCKVITPNNKCGEIGWIYIGRGGSYVDEYECPQGEDVTKNFLVEPKVNKNPPTQTSEITLSDYTRRSEITLEGSNNGGRELSTSDGSSVEIDRVGPEQLKFPPLHSPVRARLFAKMCERKGIDKKLCRQATSPNTASRSTFKRLYGKMPFHLMPNESKWAKGIELLGYAQESRDKAGACIKEIRNWFRPNKPKNYNKAVGGATRSRHINSDAIDIGYCSAKDKRKALKYFMDKRRRTGSPKGIGTYCPGSVVIHIDHTKRVYNQCKRKRRR